MGKRGLMEPEQLEGGGTGGRNVPLDIERSNERLQGRGYGGRNVPRVSEALCPERAIYCYIMRKEWKVMRYCW
jgi:hypothetical protein